ncbi:MAG: 9-O-acetylesterase [Melioribacteraceae bacterium]|nr:MAG: 9-O-acetylesterase [Melioribacteraceae bacterium]
MKRLVSILFVATAMSFFAGDLKINSLYSDNMVLQRGESLTISGEAEPDSAVEVMFNGRVFTNQADKSGNWSIDIGEHKEGGPYELVVSSKNKSITLKNILIGDVWLCSGQSNMNMPLAGWGRVLNYEEEISNADYPEIRLLKIPLTLAPEPRKNIKTKGWEVCSPESIEDFSAVGYFFGRKIHRETDVPIGLVHVSKGGTPVETWMCEEALSDRNDLKNKIEWVKASDSDLYKKLNSDYKKDFFEWLKELNENDAGYTGDTKWFELELDVSGWNTMPLPGAWEDSIGEFDGVVWFAKEVNIPESWLVNDITIDIGPVQDMDITYVNGEKAGHQMSRNSLSRYVVKPGVFKAGKNRIVTRVLDLYGSGGLWGKYDKFELKSADGQIISLEGDWFYKKAVDLTEYDEEPPKRPNPDRYPTILFNGMITPLSDMRSAGVIWYQGESNTRNAFQYREMFPRMIKHWRTHFDNEDLHFYFVQLANYALSSYNVDGEIWGTLRESQAKALVLENTGMATAIDIGDPFDVHPKNKQEVGRRLALKALKNYYKIDLPFNGPVYKDVEFKDDKAIVSFDFVYDGLRVSDSKDIREFKIAGEDENFYPAHAEISGDKIVLWSNEVENPIAVRYAWKNYPLVNLYNSPGLPVYPFRTDNFKIEGQ